MKKNKVSQLRNSTAHPQLAIIGIGCLFPKADNLNAYWSNICNGVDAITEVPETHWRAEDYCSSTAKAPEHLCTSRGGFISPVDFNPIEFGILPNAIEATDTSQLLGLMVTQQALNDAGYGANQRTFDRNRVSVIMGVTGTLELVIPLGARLGHPIWRKSLKEAGVADNVIEDVVERISASYVPWQENSFPGLLGNVVAGRIANYFDLGGTNCIIDAACASSLSALHLAGLELASGRTDMVITGGIDTFNDVFMFTCFNETQAMSPTGDARPFDTKADGTILGEGLGVLVIKRLEDARRDKDKIYAVIRGVGTSSDGRGQAIYAPNPEGQAVALRNAYELSDVTPDTIELVEAHGTGTKAGDIAELTALAEVYGSVRNEGPWCALGSVKSQIGHTKAAAGVAGIIKTAMALHHKVLPPTIKVNQPTEKIHSDPTPFYINTQKRPWLPRGAHPRRGAVSSFGFGGSNFHCVLEEYTPEKSKIDWDGQVQIVCFSAESREMIKTGLETWPKDLSWNQLRLKAHASRKAFDVQHPYRLLLVLENGGRNVSHAINKARTMLDKYPQQKAWATPDGAYFGSGAPTGKLGFIFPGQGSQYVGMFQDLACRFPQMLASIQEADRSFVNNKDNGKIKHLSDYIYPHPTFSEAAEDENERALRSTRIAQPAIGAVSFGALKVLDYFGIQPDAVAGHSYGELTALCAAERFNSRTFFSLSMLRGRLMSEGNGDKGAMLAAQATQELAQKIIREEKLDLVIANKNAPNQMVLSGTTGEIEKAAAAFQKMDIRNRRLPVSGAFHSHLVAHVKEPFLSALHGVELNVTEIPVFANTTAEMYPGDPEKARAILAAQLANPLEFVKQIENMYRFGIKTFLEVGPGAKLTGLIQAILQKRQYAAFSVDVSSGKHSGQFDLASALAFLSASGYNIILSLWDDVKEDASSESNKEKPHMVFPICGANYMNQKPEKPAFKPPNDPVGTTPDSNSATPDPSDSIQPGEGAPGFTPNEPGPNPSNLNEALRMTQENMVRLQKFQEQTTQLHRQFLENQAEVQRTFQSLVEQQHQLIQTSLGISFQPQPGTVTPSDPEIKSQTAPAPPSMMPPPGPLNPLPESNALTRTHSDPVTVPTETAHRPSEQPSQTRESEDPEQHKLPGQVADLTAGIEETLLSVVAEKTGYPVEMLELDMELDSDLGIDSIKRVEILSDLQEKLPEAPVVKPEHLGSLKTLRQIVEFLSVPSETQPKTASVFQKKKSEQRPTSERTTSSCSAENAGLETGSTNGLERKVLSSLKIDDTLARKNISLHEGSRIWITEEETGLARDLKALLLSLKYSPELISLNEPEGIELPPELNGLVILSPGADAGDDLIKNSFRLLKHAGPALKTAGKDSGAVLLTVSRMDGYFGLTSLNGQQDPAAGGIAGLLKTACHEWPEVHCKALDLAGNYSSRSSAVSSIVEEMFISGPVEVGISNSGRYALDLKPLPIKQSAPQKMDPINEGEVVVITGGARGVTADVAAAISRSFKPTLILLGRSKEPVAEPDWLVPLTDEATIKKQLLDRSDGNPSPKKIEGEYRAIMANRELIKNIDRIQSSGSKVIYYAVDVRDKEKVRSLLKDVREQIGPIKGLIHGAGVIADRLIEDKTDEQFDWVYSTKVAGLRALLEATEQDDLRVMVLFSSTTGRYGRSGQIDYAVANEVLNKFAQQQARMRPTCRVVSVNWGPWNGGMVNPSLKKIFEKEGIGLIDPATGAEYLVEEIRSNGGAPPVELVVMGKPPQDLHYKDSRISTSVSLSVAFERQLNIEDYPFLKSHVMNGRAVLPMAMMIEWMAHAALHDSPGMRFAGFDNLRVLKGLTLDGGKTTTIRLLAGKPSKKDTGRIVPAELIGSNGNGRDFVHARADIVLSPALPQADIPALEIPISPYSRKPEDIYIHGLLFHGPDFQGITQVMGYSDQGITAMAKAAPAPTEWIKNPLRSAWLTDPLILDSSFQMMILWSFEKNGVGSLPSFAGRYRQFQPAFPDTETRINIRITQDSEHKAVADIDFVDPVTGKRVASLEGYECVKDASLNCAFRCNQLPSQDDIASAKNI